MKKYEDIEADINWLADGYYSDCIEPVMEKICKISLFHDQYEFLQAGDVTLGTVEAEQLAHGLIAEESGELFDEDYFFDGLYEPKGNVNAIKEALDLMYVTAQYLNVTIGPDKAKEAWDALHQNNMSKCTNGKLLKREDGKVLKPEGYKKLDLSEIL